jgi:hypothetical protein
MDTGPDDATMITTMLRIDTAVIALLWDMWWHWLTHSGNAALMQNLSPTKTV